MTLLFACLSCALAILLTSFASDVAAASTARAHAQTAADAAALAAVAESGPYGGADPVSVAHEFADANGAELVECLCDVGATAMRVTVEVDGVIAESRAVIEVEAMMPADLDSDMARLDHVLRRSIQRLFHASAGRIHLVSGWRSPHEQATLWAEALGTYGSAEAADDWVAPPGHSMHEKGLAVDLGGDLDLAARLVVELDLPLHRPLPNEPWHFELLGAR